MPEDQNVNGDKWTEQASILLGKFGWQKIADSNIDIEGSDGFKHGIDALFKYHDGYTNIEEGVFLEAKRYETNQFRTRKIEDWVKTLTDKIAEMRTSQYLEKHYPELFNTKSRTGILAIWFHDYDNFPKIQKALREAYLTIKVPQRNIPLRLLVVANDHISRLASLADAISEWNNEHRTAAGEINELQFYYPSSMEFGGSTQATTVLNIQFMFSRFILTRGSEIINGQIQVSYAIFYFGHLDIKSITFIRDALLSFNVISEPNSNIYLYRYQENDEFRKIEPDVERIFTTSFHNLNRFVIRPMNNSSALPSWMRERRF